MTAPPPSPRATAFAILGQTLHQGRALDDVLAADGGLALLSARDRAFARLIVATTLRRLGQIDEVIGHCVARPLPKRARAVHDILRLGIAQLLFLGTPPHAAAATTVDLTQSLGFGSHKGLVNAVMRRLAREGSDLIAAQDAGRLNTPDWLWQSWCEAYGEVTARAIATQHLAEPPLDITVKDDPQTDNLKTWAERLDAMQLVTGSLRRRATPALAPPDAEAGPRQHTPIAQLAGYDQGAWWVQDAAAALPARLFGDVRGRTVIDLCAAPGGKTAQLAAAGAHVIAVERAHGRLELIAQNLARLKLTAEITHADAMAWRPAEPAPMVLLDAPCSATGTLRRHPDIAHNKTAADVARSVTLQDRLLGAAMDMVAPGGQLVYAVCSLEVIECEARIDALLATGAALKREPIAANEIGVTAEMISAVGDLRTLPCHMASEGGIDGFYACRLRRL